MRKTAISRTLALTTAALFLCIGWGNGCIPGEWGFRSKPALVADVETLGSSSVTAHREVPIVSGKNVLWCATFQLAWNELCTLAGGAARFQPPEDPMVGILNRKSVGAGDLDPASYVAVAGYVRDGIYQRIPQLLQEKFHGATHPQLLPDPSTASRPQDIVAYCYLFKQLDFPTPFERAETPLNFLGSDVASFGMSPMYKPGREKMAQGVSILTYQGPDDFILELLTKSSLDHLILAKVIPRATLAATIAEVQRRIDSGKPVPASPSDILAVPKMNFDLTRRYHELVGQQLMATAPGMPNDAHILAADQNIRFLMDEKGVQLRSETNISVGCSTEAMPQPLHRLIFDKPFLLLLSRERSKSPYFALWIGNGELFQRAD